MDVRQVLSLLDTVPTEVEGQFNEGQLTHRGTEAQGPQQQVQLFLI